MVKYRTLLNSGYGHKDITLITFRKSAADDLVHETMKYAKADVREIRNHVGTIHSICNRLIGHHDIISKADINSFVKAYGYLPYINTKRPQNGDEEESAYSGDLFDLYTWLRNTQTPVEKWYLYPGSDNILLPHERIEEFIHNYEQYKENIGRIDYSDMLQGVIDRKIPLDTPVLMVDEFQDLTAQMFSIFEMWATQCECVVIAGDPLQSIYGFWGGSPSYYSDWTAKELVLPHSYRLPSQVWAFAKTILKYEGMTPPDISAEARNALSIRQINWDDDLPAYKTELHLVRCNYQSYAVAIHLANCGKIFGGLYGWAPEEINLASAIIAFRAGKPLSGDQVIALINYYPVNLFGIKCSKDDLVSSLNKSYSPQLHTGDGFIKPQLMDSLLSDDPTRAMSFDNKLLTAKINGVKDSKAPIQCVNISKDDQKTRFPKLDRNLLTIHSSKGLEADAVFLHTAITPRIQKAIVIPGEESAAEARVWYVGSTRTREILYLVKDAGRRNYQLPKVTAWA